MTSHAYRVCAALLGLALTLQLGGCGLTARDVELRDALANGLVQATGACVGLDRLELCLTSQTDERLRVTIAAATFFTPDSDDTANMVCREEAVTTLPARGTTTLTIKVASANMHLRTPSQQETLTVSQSQATSYLKRLITSQDFGGFLFEPQQYAIWMITDDPEIDEFPAIGTQLVEQKSDGSPGAPVGPSSHKPAEQYLPAASQLLDNAKVYPLATKPRYAPQKIARGNAGMQPDQ
jgi:hypothetical protein